MTNVLGIEGGGTKTTWALFSRQGQIQAQGTASSGNTLLLSDGGLKKLFQSIRQQAGSDISAIGGAFAGCQDRAEQKRVAGMLRRIWPTARVVRAMEDTRSVLAAAFAKGPGIVVIAGTGSNVAGQNSSTDPVENAGGWGHLFSDRGSAYDISRRGMEFAFDRYDESRRISCLAQEYLSATGQKRMEQMVPFLLSHNNKMAVAKLAICVFNAAEHGDVDARKVLSEASMILANKVKFLSQRLHLSSPQVALVGGLFANQSDYRARFQRALRRSFPGATAFLLTIPGVIGAARLAGLSSTVEWKNP